MEHAPASKPLPFESRRRMMAGMFLLGAGTALALAIVNFLADNPVMAWTELTLGIVVLWISLNIRAFRSIDRAAEYSLIAGMILLTTTLFTGGTLQAGLYWFPFFPAISFFWLGQRRGLYWTLALLATAALTAVLAAFDWLTLAFDSIQIGMALLATSVIAIIAFLYERRRAQDAAALRKNIAELDKARKSAERLALAKDEFLANMSHEIRTPLNGVIGMANVLLQSPLEEDQRESASVIHDSANVLLSLINNVLDFTRMEAGRLTLENRPFNLHLLCEEVARIIAAPACQKGLEILLDYDCGLPSHFMGDKKHLRQILINLAGNAVKFTPSGHVMVRIKSVGSTENKDRIAFEVRDTGIGIPEDQQGKIFDKFSQADTAAQRSFEGSGLGLAISDRLVRMMGGKIKIESTPNKGSSFAFELELQALPGKSVVPAQRLMNRRVLIVEPYKPLADILKSHVEMLGATVEISSGRDVPQTIMHAKPFDLILLDNNLADDALKLAGAIQKLERKSKPLIYLLKGPTSVFTAKDLDTAGIWATITKPVIHRELTERLLNLGKPEPKPKTPAGGRKENLQVLLVEDNLVNQKVARHFLERCGCTVDLAVNGLQAVNAAFSKPYDLIFMDCQMPEMDGYEATRVIRSTERQVEDPQHVPIIALTAHALESDREKCIAAGMDDYLSKPIDQKKLKKIIDLFFAATHD